MKPKLLLFLALTFLGVSFAGFTNAVCPVCVVAVGAGVGLCRWLGIDDIISGIWMGGLTASLIMFTYFWLVKKGWVFRFSKTIVSLIYYLLIFAPLYFYNIVGHPLNKLWGVDKLLLGIILGTVAFLLSYWIDVFLRKKNGGNIYFYYQKVKSQLHR